MQCVCVWGGGSCFIILFCGGFVHLSFEIRLHIAQVSSLSPHSKVRPTVSQACPAYLWEHDGAQNSKWSILMCIFWLSQHSSFQYTKGVYVSFSFAMARWQLGGAKGHSRKSLTSCGQRSHRGFGVGKGEKGVEERRQRRREKRDGKAGVRVGWGNALPFYEGTLHLCK